MQQGMSRRGLEGANVVLNQCLTTVLETALRGMAAFPVNVGPMFTPK